MKPNPWAGTAALSPGEHDVERALGRHYAWRILSTLGRPSSEVDARVQAFAATSVAISVVAEAPLARRLAWLGAVALALFRASRHVRRQRRRKRRLARALGREVL